MSEIRKMEFGVGCAAFSLPHHPQRAICSVRHGEKIGEFKSRMYMNEEYEGGDDVRQDDRYVMRRDGEWKRGPGRLIAL